MVRQTRSIVALLMRLGTDRRVQVFLAMILPVISRMKSPSIRLLMTTMVPQMVATSFRHMNDEDKLAVLERFTSLVEEYRTDKSEQTAA